MLPLRSCISVLCAVGLYASVFMLRKSIAAARGELSEPSVVQTERARLFAGLPNALFGCAYYPIVCALAWSPPAPAVRWCATIAACAAGATSLYLAYSLLYVTRRSCLYCWSAHAVNWMLVVSVAWLLAP